jgi:hypothetical protein
MLTWWPIGRWLTDETYEDMFQNRFLGRILVFPPGRTHLAPGRTAPEQNTEMLLGE